MTDADLYALAERLYPLPRSLTGPGVLQTFDVLDEYVPDLTRHAVPSGTKVFDWTVPDEWELRDAWVEMPNGTRLSMQSPLNVVGYSHPVDRTVDRDELAEHVHTLPDRPHTTPYRTAYYGDTWGFCMPHRIWEQMPDGDYRVRIDARKEPGDLHYAEAVIPGREAEQVLLSTYVCHPNLANDNVSGIVLAAALAEWLASEPRRYTYRLVFAPETIGALCWMWDKHESETDWNWNAKDYLTAGGNPIGLDALRSNTIAGYVLTCVGDERAWSFLPSRKGDTLADRAARHVLKWTPDGERWVDEHGTPTIGATEYPFTERGSDERQYCAPGIDLPVASVMRSKYATYPEYHTSDDNLDLITPKGLGDSFRAYQRIIETIEANRTYRVTVLGEPKLDQHGLYPKTGGPDDTAKLARDLCAFSDGTEDLIAVCDRIGAPVWDAAAVVDRLVSVGLLESR